MNFKEFCTKFLTPENISEYKNQTEKLVFVSDLTGLSVDHHFVDKLDLMLWNLTAKKEV